MQFVCYFHTVTDIYICHQISRCIALIIYEVWMRMVGNTIYDFGTNWTLMCYFQHLYKMTSDVYKINCANNECSKLQLSIMNIFSWTTNISNFIAYQNHYVCSLLSWLRQLLVWFFKLTQTLLHPSSRIPRLAPHSRHQCNWKQKIRK